MSVKTLIQEAMNKNALGFEMSLKEELRSRIGLALEAKMKEQECEGEMSESMQLDELSPATLQRYADKAKRDYNSMDAWADEEGMGSYRERMSSKNDPDAPYDNSTHWSTKRQTKRVKGLKLAKARDIVPSNPKAGKKLTAAERLRTDSRGLVGGGGNRDL